MGTIEVPEPPNPDFHRTADLLPEPMLLASVDGRILAVNRALAEQLGWDQRAIPATPLAQLIAGSWQPVHDYLRLCAASEQMIPGSIVLRRQDRLDLEYRAAGVAFPAAHTGATAAVLLRLTPKADNTDFLAILAHELRNPLAPIRNALQVMRVAEGDHAVTTAARSMIERQLKHLVRLIDELMDVSRLTQGRLELHRERAHLQTVLQAAVDSSRPLLESKQHRFRLEIAKEPLFVDADIVRLSQVFSNLLNNSAKYSAPGGEISVCAERVGSEVVVSVVDCGVGIPAQMLDRIFDMFVRVDRSMAGPHEGLGIGLTLVKRIVELHDGSVEARSEGVGKGSTFRVRLPLAQSAAVTPAAPSPESERSAVLRTRILIADDNHDAAQSLAFMLEMDGHDVRIAHDGLQALEIAENFMPQVALLDIGMPRLDGYGTARELRTRSWARSLCLVALTGWGQEEDRRRAQEAGFDRHLVKPVDPDILNRLIARTHQVQ